MAGNASKSYTIRAAGADRSMQRFLLGKFPSHIPDLRGLGPWSLSKEERAGGEEWGLEGPTSNRFRGITERSLAGNEPSNYFVLVRQKGVDEFLAIPVHEWATFRPDDRRPQQSLEDAEAAMKYQRIQAEKAANTKLAQAISSAAGGDEEGGAAGADDGVDSDEEWKDIKARAATVIEANKTGTSEQKATTAGDSLKATIGQGVHSGGGLHGRRGRVYDEDDEDMKASIRSDPRASFYVPRPRDAEDWEHEDEAADDDVDMGDTLGEDVETSPVRGRPSPAVSDDEQQLEENGFSQRKEKSRPSDVEGVKRAIRRMMKSTGMDDSESDERVGSEEDEDEDDDYGVENEEDLDKMAEEILPTSAGVKSSSDEARETSRKSGAHRKRKSPSPAAAGTAGDVAIKGSKSFASEMAGLKKARVQIPEKEKADSAAGKALSGVTKAQGPPTKEEVAQFVRERGRVLLKDLTAAFSKRLTTPESRKEFSQLVKSVAKLDPQQDPSDKLKYLVPK